MFRSYSIFFILVFDAVKNKLQFGVFGQSSVFGCLDFSLITKRRDKSVRCHYRARRLQNKTLRKCDYELASRVVIFAHPQRFKVCRCTRAPQTDLFHKRHDSQWPMNKKRMKCPVYILTVHYPIAGNTLSSPYCV